VSPIARFASLVVLAAACTPVGPGATRLPDPSAASFAAPEIEPGSEPSSALSELVALPVPGHLAAVVSVPRETTTPRPLLVSAHGAGGRPEPHCAFFRRLVAGRAFVLCPRGARLGTDAPLDQGGFFYPNHHALGREVVAALAALAARFGARVDLRAPVYAGFSQGATMGALAFVKQGGPFARMLLIEGGVGEYDEWTIANARAFHEGGGARVLLACGREACAEAARRTEGRLAKAGLDARAVYGAAGHTYGGAVGEAIEAALPWLFDGDPRWLGSGGAAAQP